MTLANPSVAQERTRLAIVATTTHAHTVTTAATKINGADDTVTYAAVGDGIVLEARNQGWIVIASIGGATLSEV
jgi:phage tail sheath gpL-like